MARVTVEDCVLKIPNRFELVMLAAQRARDVSSGAPLTVNRDADKNPVVALREIAEETVNLDQLHDSLIQGLQKHVEVDEPEEGEGEFEIPGISTSPDAPESLTSSSRFSAGVALSRAPSVASTTARCSSVVSVFTSGCSGAKTI